MIHKLAAIDIGSNATRLLLTTQDSTLPLSFNTDNSEYIRIPIRLGNDVFSQGNISTSNILLLITTLRNFRQRMEEYGIERFRICATSAMRDASNKHQVVEEIKAATGLSIEIISGNEEAMLTRNSYLPTIDEQHLDFIFVDVGGGSTEVSWIRNDNVLYTNSFQIGSMRILTKEEWRVQLQCLDNTLEKFITNNCNLSTIKLLATGGNIHKVCQLIEEGSSKLTTEQLKNLVSTMSLLTPQQISQTFSISIDRADIIVPALRIYLQIATTLNATHICAPTMSLRFGIIRQLLLSDNS